MRTTGIPCGWVTEEAIINSAQVSLKRAGLTAATGIGPGRDAKVRAYRMVTGDTALQRWLNGVSENRKAALIPPGWFDRWQEGNLGN